MSFKTLLFALLLPLTCLGQYTRDEYFREGMPTFSAPTNQARSIDFKNQRVYTFTKSTAKWAVETDTNIIRMYLGGRDGRDGIDGRNGVDGKDGVCPTCPPTSGGSYPGLTVHNSYVIETITEIQVGGIGTNVTVGSATYSGITVTGTDLTDFANLQLGLYLAGAKKKKLNTSGQFNVNRGVDIGKMSYRLSWDGNNTTEIKTQNANAFTVVGRAAPIDNGDANLMIQATYVIKNIRITASQTQIGLEPGPTYSSLYENIRVRNALTGIHLRFNLNARVTLCDAGSCINGFIADMGNWTGATTSNSQSNHTFFTQCHAYMPTNGNVAFGIYAASGVKMLSCIIEGHVVVNGIDFDAKGSSVVKDFTVENVHFECVQGATNAFIKIRIAGGTVTINKAFGQYAGLFMDASSSSGLGFVHVANIPWWVKRADGKLFRTANISQHYERNEAFGDLPASLWEGTAPALCGGNACGYHRYTLTKIPR